MKKVFLITALSLLVSGIVNAADITGTWKGYFNSEAGYARVTMEIEQYEDGTIAGDWTASDGYGTVGGKRKGHTLKFKLVSEECSGRYSGKGRLSKDETQIKYTLSGSDECNGELSGGGKLYYKE